MPKKISLFLVGFIFFFSYNLSHAQVIFNEIAWKGMATGATHEWLELLNIGTQPEDISGWTVKDDTGQLNILIPSGASISAGGFYVIKRSTSTVTPFNLSVSFNGGLADSGEKLILRDTSAAQVDVADFLSGWPDTAMTFENTMQWNGSSWITATPTPGAANPTSAPEDEESEDEDPENTDSSTQSDGSTVVGGSSSTSSKKSVDSGKPKINPKITVPKIVFVNIPFEIKGEAFDNHGNKLIYKKYFWNFGDGNSKKTREKEEFPYTYFYPGDYTISLEYYLTDFSEKPDLVVEAAVKVVPLDISISKVGDDKDFFIELSNNTGYMVDVSSWVLSSLDKKFILPRNSAIPSKKKIILPAKITNFSLTDKENLKLSTDKDQLVFDYGISATVPEVATALKPPIQPEVKKVAPVDSKKEIKTSPNVQKSSNSTSKSTKNMIVEKADTKEAPLSSLPSKELVAQVSSADALDGNTDGSYFPVIILLIFIGSAAGSVYYMRRKNVLPRGDSQDDFTILDE